jgi:hypothetical protein
MSGATCAIFMMIFNVSSDKNTLRRPRAEGGQPEPIWYRNDAGSRLRHLAEPSRMESVLF